MNFGDFLGNARVVEVLRRMLASDRVPSTLLFAGPVGVGKFTLATLFARAANCERSPGEICEECGNCHRLARLEDLETMRRVAVEARGSAKPDEVPLILQPHPSVAVLVPDGSYIRVAQMRYLVGQAYAVPVQARRNIFLIDQAERLRFDYADVLLKVLEEPPEKTTLILITAYPYELRPTIRSRSIPFHFAPLSRTEVERSLAQHRPEWKPKQRELGAHLAAGSPGTALRLDLERTLELRAQALIFLRAGLQGGGRVDALFAATTALAGKARAGTRSGEPASREGNEFEFSLEILYALASDLAYLKAGTPGLELRNPDLRSELQTLGREISWNRIRQLVQGLDQLEGWQRRNVNRQLALDALALGGFGSETGM
jgi:DNA polymerase-3 subunit delta'